jgi:nucleoside 2-deoxyribosyltransferase
MKSIYLAGPDVFFRDAPAHFDALEARCAAHGLRGVRPSDGGLAAGSHGTGDEIAERIYRANIALIGECEALLANLMPFRNALEPDSGTVFELGVAVALGKAVAGVVSRRDTSYEHKVIAECGVTHDALGRAWDARHGFMVEQFGQPMNLMLARSTPLFERCDDALAHLARSLSAPPGRRLRRPPPERA